MTTSIPDYISTENHVDGITHITEAGQELRVPGDLTPVSQAVCVVTEQVQGVTHIVVAADTSPACIVENLCSFDLQYGQAHDKLTGKGNLVKILL